MPRCFLGTHRNRGGRTVQHDDGVQRTLIDITPENRNFRIPPQRVIVAKRSVAKVTLVLVALTVAAVTPWIVVPASRGMATMHWVSLALLALVAAAALATWRIRASAKWWQGSDASVLHITNDEVVIRGTIRIPTHVIAGVWAYEQPEALTPRRPVPIRRWLSDLGASTAQLTILVNTVAPIIDPHLHVRRFHRAEEVAGRIEVPIGAYLDEPGTLEEILDTFTRTVTPGRPVIQTTSASDYGLAWSGSPALIEDNEHGTR